MENEGPQKNRRKPGRGTATMAVAATTVWPWLPPRAVVVTTVGPWWPLAQVLQFCPVRRVLSFLPSSADCLSWAICFGLLGLVCFLSSLGLMSNHIIFTKVGPKLENLQENSTRPKPSIIGDIVDKMQINANYYQLSSLKLLKIPMHDLHLSRTSHTKFPPFTLSFDFQSAF